MASFIIPFKALFFLIVALHQSSSVFSSSSSIAANETETLLKWKASLDNNTQTLLSSWVGGNHCNWVGITCDMAGTITNLSLPDHLLNLKGKIPPEIGVLSNLEHLNLASNNLSGPIPNQLGECSKLLDLNLSKNKLGESIPLSVSYINGLRNLDLSQNLLYWGDTTTACKITFLGNIGPFSQYA
ncbi:LRR receptor-like serine/threonine-protein kinase FLS2 [Durio zibethinus]|uniref:LRR receptor-like serine/threonine-protein kinase FLS2 n=1 Tax=Durio zibethinus TaxID=66656 RepID=A0A6P5YNZ1_DURZI|nr:LRR receptor-like serine/threonine-protein kinase FLS2 [Durio zibethinus]